MAALGTYPLGVESLGSTVVLDRPTVTVLAPGPTPVTSGGPNLVVLWEYEQTQGQPQAQYRVVVENSTGTVAYADTGWVSGAASSATVDLVAEGAPTDSADLSVRVGARWRTGVSATEGWSPRATFEVQWGVPSATVTAPADGAVLGGSTASITWSFASTRGKAQEAWQARLRGAESNLVYEDTGWVSGTDGAYTYGWPLADGTAYDLQVRVRNTEGVPSPWATVSVSSQPTVAAPEAEEPRVGTLYEIGLNGVGFMLFDSPESELQYRRRTVSLDPPRLATGETPFSQAVERYAFAAAADWRYGRGQRFGSRQGSVPGAFWDSEGVNPFEPYQLSLLDGTAVGVTSAYSALRAVTVGSGLVAQTGAKQLTHLTAPAATPTVFSVAAATTITSLTSDGQSWYAAAGTAGVFKGTTSDPGAAWSTVQADVVGWGAGRVLAAYKSSSSTPNRFTTINSSGTDENASGRLTLPAGWTITGFTSGGGYVFFGAYSGEIGVVYAWAAGSSDAPFVCLELPAGHVPVEVFWYQGQVMVRSRNGTTASIWRCPLDGAGQLQPFLVADLEVEGEDVSGGGFAADERFVYFAWPYGGGDGAVSGVGALDLSTGGHARWHMAAADGAVSTVAVWQNRVVFCVVGTGVVWSTPGTFVADGWLKTSLYDGDSHLQKVWGEVVLETQPLTAGTSVSVEVSTNKGDSYTSLLTLATLGRQRATVDAGRRSATLGLKLVLAGDGSGTPTVTALSARYHALGLADQVVVLPVDCGDNVAGLNGQRLPYTPGAGVRRARALEELVQTRVRFQDVDWHETGGSSVWDLIDVDVRRVGLRDTHRGKVANRLVAVCTLRRGLK